jgi:hypothetical protein
MQDVFERLVAANIQLLPVSVSPRHVVFERGGFVALVERNDMGFGSIGGAGVLTEKGFAPLVWRGGQPYFVAKAFEKAASVDEVEGVRAFQRELESALEGNPV